MTPRTDDGLLEAVIDDAVAVQRPDDDSGVTGNGAQQQASADADGYTARRDSATRQETESTLS